MKKSELFILLIAGIMAVELTFYLIPKQGFIVSGLVGLLFFVIFIFGMNKAVFVFSKKSHNKKKLVRKPSDTQHRDIPQSPLGGVLIVAFPLLLFGGYFVVKHDLKDFKYWHYVLESSVFIYGAAQLLMIVLFLKATKDLKRFVGKFSIVDTKEALNSLKQVLRRNMQTALSILLLTCVSYISIAMIVDFYGKNFGLAAMGISVFLSVILGSLATPLEKACLQIPCDEEETEKELHAVFVSWRNDLFPKF